MPNPGVALGGAGLVSSIVGGRKQAKATQAAANTAAAAQTESAQAGIEEQRRQFDESRALLKPFVDIGLPALAQQRGLLGLSGPQVQQEYIRQIEQSPAFQAQIAAQENAMLQNASATGGLRGGNLQAALAQFRPAMLQNEINARYAKLGDLVSLGQQSAAGVGTSGQMLGANVSNLLAQQGSARAGAALAGGQSATGQFFSAIPGALGAYYGATGKNPFGNLFGGSAAPAMAASGGGGLYDFNTAGVKLGGM